MAHDPEFILFYIARNFSAHIPILQRFANHSGEYSAESLFGETTDRNLNAALYAAMPVRDVSIECDLWGNKLDCEMKPSLLLMRTQDEWNSSVFELAFAACSQDLSSKDIKATILVPGYSAKSIVHEEATHAFLCFVPWRRTWKAILIDYEEDIVATRIAPEEPSEDLKNAANAFLHSMLSDEMEVDRNAKISEHSTLKGEFEASMVVSAMTATSRQEPLHSPTPLGQGSKCDRRTSSLFGALKMLVFSIEFPLYSNHTEEDI